MGRQPATDSSRGRVRQQIARAGSGLVLAALAWDAAAGLGLTGFLPALLQEHGLVAAGLLGALLGVTRGRWLLWSAAASLVGLRLLIIYTPVTAFLLREVERQDPLDITRPADAAVVLSTGIFPDGHLPVQQQNRLLHGYEVVRAGYARRLVLTRLADPNPSYLPVVREQLKELGLVVPVEEAGPVGNTHDEALAVARLAGQRGWRRVIVVTDFTHTRRAGGTFLKAGLEVLVSPPPHASEYDPWRPGTADERRKAFRDWLREIVGYRIYQTRGWL